MFTGLIEDRGRVATLERDDAGAVLTIATSLAGEIALGDSIAVSGVCLTATAVDPGGDGGPGSFRAQAMHETLSRSALGALEQGGEVNLELALRADARLGGHIVQGHVDGTAAVTQVEPDGFSRVITLEVAPALLRYVVQKGSIALDGVSLTVSALGEDTLSVSLIPETLERTTLGSWLAGRIVNVEVDVLAKHVERLLGPIPSPPVS
jgi:riboflavin synthase